MLFRASEPSKVSTPSVPIRSERLETVCILRQYTKAKYKEKVCGDMRIYGYAVLYGSGRRGVASVLEGYLMGGKARIRQDVSFCAFCMSL